MTNTAAMTVSRSPRLEMGMIAGTRHGNRLVRRDRSCRRGRREGAREPPRYLDSTQLARFLWPSQDLRNGIPLS